MINDELQTANCERRTASLYIKTLFCLSLSTAAVQAQTFSGIPASDTLGAEDLAGNPTFIGGVANGGGTSHGVW